MLATDEHFRLIEKAVLEGPAKSSEWRTASWARCLQDYKLDPSRLELVELSSREMRDQTEIFDADIALATSEIESTLTMIEGGGYSPILPIKTA